MGRKKNVSVDAPIAPPPAARIKPPANPNPSAKFWDVTFTNGFTQRVSASVGMAYLSQMQKRGSKKSGVVAAVPAKPNSLRPVNVREVDVEIHDPDNQFDIVTEAE
jgi:hypothetical protein